MLKDILGALWLFVVPCLIAAQAEIKQIPLRTHSLQSPYLDSDMSNRWWDFGGDTIIRADQYIRLASDNPSQSGYIFSRIPLTATNWEIEFEFSITGKGNLHGDGFAMWVTADRAAPGPVFGHKDNFEGLGLFFDTYKNNRPGVVFPYVMGMLGDGKTPYDAANDGKANEIGGCSARGIRGASIPTKAKVTYFQDKSLTVKLQYKATDIWEDCFEITSANFNRDIKLPTTGYLGFSAHTGELSDNFDIVSVETRSLYNPQAGTVGRGGSGGAPLGSGSFSHHEKKSGGWVWFFVKVFIFGLFVGCGYVGWTKYKNQNKRYKGF